MINKEYLVKKYGVPCDAGPGRTNEKTGERVLPKLCKVPLGDFIAMYIEHRGFEPPPLPS